MSTLHCVAIQGSERLCWGEARGRAWQQEAVPEPLPLCLSPAGAFHYGRGKVLAGGAAGALPHYFSPAGVFHCGRERVQQQDPTLLKIV